MELSIIAEKAGDGEIKVIKGAGKTGLLGALCLFLLLGSFRPLTASAAGETVAANDARIRYLGRWDITDGVASGYFESGLELAFTGTSIAVDFAAKSGYLYQIDGGAYTDLTSAKGIQILAQGLDNGEHTLKLYARFEGACPRIAGYRLDDGAQLKTPAEKPTVEFIGDSITVGWVGRDYPRHNQFGSSYALLAGEKLGWNATAVAFGGITLVPGSGSPDSGGMPARYLRLGEYSAGEAAEKSWDTARYTPDTVVINLGTNDSAADADFETAYVAFLEQLRGYYPEARLAAMTPFGGKYREAIRKAVRTRSEAGDTAVDFVDTTGWIGAGDTTDGVHLTVQAQQRAADRLAAALVPDADGESSVSGNSSVSAVPAPVTTAPPAALSGFDAGFWGPVLGAAGGGVLLIGGVIVLLAVMSRRSSVKEETNDDQHG